MEKEQFQKVMEALDHRLRACALQLQDIYSTDDLSKVSLARAAELKSFCISEEEIMTKIAMVDLYHIIGMGELTPPQMTKFTYTLQKYLKFRPTIKAIAKWTCDVFELPKIPVETQYKLQGLGGITLYSNCENKEACVVDSSCVDDYNSMKTGESKTEDCKLPFKINGNQIRVDMNQFEYFVALVTNISKTPLNVDNFRRKIINLGEYLGIKWLEYNEDEAAGQFVSSDIRDRLTGYYNKHK